VNQVGRKSPFIDGVFVYDPATRTGFTICVEHYWALATGGEVFRAGDTFQCWRPNPGRLTYQATAGVLA
jgi:hypothetical protein